jgi:superfamily II DNA or RNA helicase
MYEIVQKYLNTLPIETRDYQVRIISKALEYYINDNIHSIMIESPTGSGKTLISLIIIKILQEHFGYGTWGWVAMRRNLLEQARIENERIGASLEYISMFSKHPPKVDALMIDEGHHDATDSCLNIHNLTQPKVILSCTATPYRSDRTKLSFEKVIKDAGIQQLIHQGYLSSYAHFTIPDWKVETVCEIFLNERDRWGKSLLFFPSLSECNLAREIIGSGEVVTGSSDREEQVRNFTKGKVSLLINCMVLTEGFDFPDLQTVFVRPSSKGCTIQMGGRVLRKSSVQKNIVQSRDTKWPFPKTATPRESFVRSEQNSLLWQALTPDMEKISVANNNSLRSIAKINIELPKFITDKRKNGRGRQRRSL